jgi:hypothetical protein
MNTPLESTPPPVPARAQQGGEPGARKVPAEPAVWTERMLTALVTGLKGNRWFRLIDPDGHALSFRWFHYPEAGRVRGARPPIPIADSGAFEASFIVPEVRGRETLHIILEVVDDGLPALFAYRRLLVNVR